MLLQSINQSGKIFTLTRVVVSFRNENLIIIFFFSLDLLVIVVSVIGMAVA